MTKVLERGNIFFLYRPRVGEDEPEGRKDVQRMHIVLDPQGEGRMRRIVVGEKRLPPIRDGGGKNWGFVDEVSSSKKKVSEASKKEEYTTKTRGTQERPPERPAAEGVYALVEHDDHNHIAYKLELPDEPGEVQEELNIEEEGSYILAVKNPEKPAPKGVGLGERRKADLPKSLQERFRGRRFIPAEPDLLKHEGVELLFIGAREDVSDELGIKLDPQDETEQSSELLRKLDLPAREHPREPMMEGEWE